MKPVIGIDWNSTLQNQVGEICSRTCLVPGDFDRWNPQLGSHIGMTEAAFSLWAWGSASIQAEARPYEGAVAGVSRLASWATIWIVTSTGCPGLVEPWLSRWGIPYNRVIVTSDKGSVAWDVLLDDNPITLSKLFAQGRQVLRHEAVVWNNHLTHIQGFNWESLKQGI